MDPALVLAKTAKGREEIEKRTFRLEARRRVMLILVDGQSSAEDLSSRSSDADEAMTTLQFLWTEGFIEPAGAFAGAQPEAAQMAAPVIQTTKSLSELQRLASKSIENLLGPEGENMALRLEKTKTMEQFLAEAQHTRDTLKQFVGQRKADLFWAALGL